MFINYGHQCSLIVNICPLHFKYSLKNKYEIIVTISHSFGQVGSYYVYVSLLEPKWASHELSLNHTHFLFAVYSMNENHSTHAYLLLWTMTINC